MSKSKAQQLQDLLTGASRFHVTCENAAYEWESNIRREHNWKIMCAAIDGVRALSAQALTLAYDVEDGFAISGQIARMLNNMMDDRHQCSKMADRELRAAGEW